MAKTLLGTELGHNLQKFRPIGSKFGLIGLQDMIICKGSSYAENPDK